jgi:hypothetical protein
MADDLTMANDIANPKKEEPCNERGKGMELKQLLDLR